MNLSKYADYKKSNVSWLGEIPSNWSVQSCRGVLKDRNERNDPQINENYLSLMANIGIILYEEKGDVGNKKPEDLGKCKQVYPGDLVINSMNYGIGSYGLSKHRGVCSPVYIVLTPKLEKIEERYAFRILEIKKFQQYAQSFGNGILEHRASISWDILKNIGLPLPPIEEQKAILGFLDNEIEKIDTLVKDQERLIDLLVEKRQAVISHTVTKGLDPKVKMKPSGLGLLSEVPQHWEVKPIQWIASINDEVLPESTDGDYEIEYVDIGSVNLSSGIERSEIHKFKDAPSRARRIVKNGDVIVSTVRTYLKAIAFVKEPPENMIVSTGFAVIRSKSGLESNFAKFGLQSTNFIDEVISRSTGISYPAINASDLAKIKIPIPPIEEQIAICDYLDKQTLEIDSLISESKKIIVLLQERRSALISAAVTGQIDVRNYQPKDVA
jgi:type I restriction enzyme S subunit